MYLSYGWISLSLYREIQYIHIYILSIYLYLKKYLSISLICLCIERDLIVGAGKPVIYKADCQVENADRSWCCSLEAEICRPSAWKLTEFLHYSLDVEFLLQETCLFSRKLVFAPGNLSLLFNWFDEAHHIMADHLLYLQSTDYRC